MQREEKSLNYYKFSEEETGYFTQINRVLAEPFGSLLLFVVGVSLACLGAGLGFGVLVKTAFSDLCTSGAAAQAQYNGCFTYSEFFGVNLAAFCTPFGFFFMGIGLLHLSRNEHWSVSFRCGFLLLVIAIYVITIIVSFIYLIKPFADDANMEVFQRFLGCCLVLVCTAYCFVCMNFIYHLLVPIAPISSNSSSSPPQLEYNSFSDNWPTIVISFLFFSVLFLMCIILPPIWDNMTPRAYLISSSPEATNYVVNNKLILKIYPDVLAFYLFIFSLIFVGSLAQMVHPLRTLLHQRMRFYSPRFSHRSKFAIFFVFPYGVTVGEVLVILEVIGLFVYWFYYWRFSYDRIQSDPYDPVKYNDPSPLLHIYARVFGHLNSLCVSLLLLPTTRNSIWESLFGISFERAIKYHRILSFFSYILLCVHMILWYLHWAVQGNLWHNVVAIQYLRITDIAVHFDNFSIVLAETGFVFLTIAIILAYWFRRRNYELFYFAHHFAVVMFIITLIHAWSHWYYVIGSLLLWLYDRIIRVIRGGSQNIELVYAEHFGGVTKLVFRGGMNKLKHTVGQYAYINVPALSIFEWHPFSFSSPPSSNFRTFHIKDMGPGTFTNRLAQLVGKSGSTPSTPPTTIPPASPSTLPTDSTPLFASYKKFAVYIDGPYGKCSPVTRYENLLLIAGGIGITPIISLFSELYERARRAQSNDIRSEENPNSGGYATNGLWPELRNIHIVFTSGEVSTILAFSEVFNAVRQNNPFNLFHFSLFSTQQNRNFNNQNSNFNMYPVTFSDVNKDAVEAIAPLIQHDRPDLERIFLDTRQDIERNSNKNNVMVLVCGPVSLVDQVSELCFQFQFDFHTETFLL